MSFEAMRRQSSKVLTLVLNRRKSKQGSTKALKDFSTCAVEAAFWGTSMETAREVE